MIGYNDVQERETCMKRKNYLNDLEAIFQEALKNKQFSTAIKAKELQVKEWEKAEKKKAEKVKKTLLYDLPKQDLLNFITQTEQENPYDLEDIKQEIKDLETALNKRDSLKKDLEETYSC